MNTPARALRQRLVEADGRPVLFDLYERSRSGSELVENVDRLSGAVLEASREKPRVGLWYRNSLSAVEAFLAVEWIGGTRVPVDPGASAEEARAVFEAAAVDIVLTDASHGAAFSGNALIHDDQHRLAGYPREPVNFFDPGQTLVLYPRAVVGGRLFGIPLSYRNWNAIVETNVALYRSKRYGAWDESSEVFLTAQQLMHGSGFLGTFPFLAMGLPQVIVDQFNITKVVDAIERHRVTSLMTVPAMLQALIGAAEQEPRRVASLRHILYGGAPMPEEQLVRGIQLFSGALTQVYGRVEGGWPISTLGTAAHTAIGEGTSKLLGSCGQPIAEVQTRLRPIPVEPEDVGELLVKSEMTSAEYADADGWCSLGDVMRRDEAGNLFYLRRLDRMINTGYHVYPEEIEAMIAAEPGIASVRVVGEAHPDWGQMVVAYVVPTTNVSTESLPSSLKAALERRLAKYKIPREFRIVHEIPSAA